MSRSADLRDIFIVKVGAKVLFDASQAVPAMPVDVQAIGADFIAGTAHKLCGPTGIGFLWGRQEPRAPLQNCLQRPEASQ